MAVVHLKFVNTRIFRTLLSLASAALLIRVIGMFNQVVVSAHFGAGAVIDAYFVASALPILMAQLVTNAMEYSVIPVYTRVRAVGTKEQASRIFNTLLNLILMATVLLTLLMIVFRHQIIFLSAPALGPFRTGLAIDLTFFFFPVFQLMVVIGFLECILNAEGQFGWPAYAGMLVPLTTALLVLVVGRKWGVVTLGVGMLIGLCLQLCMVIVRGLRAGIIYQPILDVHNPEIGLILTATWPVLLGALITQAGPLVDQIFASFLSAGSISAINYSLKIISVPIGVIFISVGRAALPYLSRQAAAKDLQAFKETLRLYLWVLGIGTMVLAALLLLFAHPLVQVLFQRGAFSAGDTKRTAYTLMGFIIGLTPMSFGFILPKAMSALGKTKVLMYVAIFSIIANAVLDAIFAHFWQSFGIALATSVVYACTACILLLTLRRTIGNLDLFIPPPELLAELRKVTTGQYYRQLTNWQDEALSSMSISRKLRLQILGVGGAIVVFIAGAISILFHSLTPLHITIGAFVVLAFLRFRYALLLAWVLVNPLIGSGSPLPFFNGNHFLTDLIVPALLLMFCMPIKHTFQRMPSLALLLLFLLWIFASINISPIGHGPFLNFWIPYLLYVAVGVLTICLLTTRQHMMRLIDVMLLFSAFVSLYGIYGYVTKHRVIHDPFTSFSRIISIFGSAPTLALFLSIVIPLALYRTFTLQGFKRVGGVMLTLILLVAVGLSFTRSAYFCVPMSILIMALFLPSQMMKIGTLSGILALAAFVALLTIVGHVPIFGRFFNRDLLTLNGRTYLWQALLAHFDPTQLLGKGFRASDVLLAKLRVRDERGVIGTVAHNVFMETLFDHGIIGVTILTAVFTSLFVSLIAGIRKTKGDHRMLFAAALAGLASVLVQSLGTNDLLTFLAVGIYFWVVMALPFAIHWSTWEKPSVETTASSFSERKIPPIEAIHQAEMQRNAEERDGVREGCLHICLLSLKFSPIIGGSEIQMERQARQLQAMGHKVTVVTLRLDKRWKKKEMLGGLPVVRVGGIFRREGQLRIGRLGHLPVDIALFLTLWRLHRQYDVIHVFQALPPAAVATLIGKITQKPVIIQIQSPGPADAQRQQLECGATLMADALTDTDFLKIDRMDWVHSTGDITYLPRVALGGHVMVNFLRNSDAFYHILSTRSHSYLTSHGFRPEQIVYIPNGVDMEKFRSAAERRPARERAERKIICVARLEYAKGIDVLLHAWGRMMREPAEWRAHLRPTLHLVGDGKLRQKIERIATELGIQDSVEFLGTRTDIVDLLQQSWGFVIPSRWEGMPNALLEAMACGLPCVATRVSGSEDIISDGLNGLLVEPEQPSLMAEALRRIIEDTELAERLGQEGHTAVVRDYQLKNVVEKCLALYRRLLTKGKCALPVVLEGRRSNE